MGSKINRFIFYCSLIVSTLALSCSNEPPESKEPPQKITIAGMLHSFTGYTLFVAQERGFFQEAGLDVTLQNTFPHGRATLQALDENKADLAVSSETPFMHAVLSGAKIYAIAVMLKAHNHLGIVCRKDRGILSAQDLIGKRIGVTLGSNGEYFLDTFLLLNEIERREVETVHIKPGNMYAALMSGEVDAIATWNPQKHKAEKDLGTNGNTFNAEGFYSPYFIVSASKDFVRSQPEAITKVVRALHHASQFINNNPGQAQLIVATQLKTDPQLLGELSATYSFGTTLDQSFVITLENQGRWAIKNGLADRSEPPNFLEYIYMDALEQVAPSSLTIIR